jgi:hypothetical protein
VDAHWRVDGQRSGVATCSCSWQSTPAQAEGQVDVRWRIHLLERRAAEWIETASSMRSDAIRRTQLLEQQRLAATARRRAIQAQRMRLRVAIERARRCEDVEPPAPCARTACRPAVPSLRVPESTTPTTRGPK